MHTCLVLGREGGSETARTRGGGQPGVLDDNHHGEYQVKMLVSLEGSTSCPLHKKMRKFEKH